MHGTSETSASGWTSRFAFLMASIGFAVGLGNIWRFPYVTGENGGSAFVMVYILCAVVIGLPILIAELTIGRRGAKSPPSAMADVAEAAGRSRAWQIVGTMNLLTAFLIMVTYCVVAGWVLNYVFIATTTGFENVTGEIATATFDGLLANVSGMLFWTLLGLVVTGSIIYAGVQNGIERAVTIMMPLLFVLMLCLVGYNIAVGGFSEAVDYLFTPDFSKINGDVMLAALGQAFFSIGVAMAGMMTFGAYLPKRISIPRSVLIIITADTCIALLAGLVIFPAVFNNGLDPAGGPGLIFKTLPVAFAQMPGGHIISSLFFILLAVAAVTSMVGLIEPLVHWLQESRKYGRHKAALLVLGAIAVLSIISILSYNHWSEFHILGLDINSLIDFISNQILLPLGGLFIAVFAGWFMQRSQLEDELDMQGSRLFAGIYLLLKFIVPPAVFVVFMLGIS